MPGGDGIPRGRAGRAVLDGGWPDRSGTVMFMHSGTASKKLWTRR
ncbi:hypothetical protein [Micromonospora andamanensis]|nr:hypothetical protein [Micromonospora andamanensis]